jgi:hypothetical protein
LVSLLAAEPAPLADFVKLAIPFGPDRRAAASEVMTKPTAISPKLVTSSN